MININRVTIHNTNIPPPADKFSKDFARCHVTLLIDFFSGYDQISLDLELRDLTAIQTLKGLLQQTTLMQGATNSIAQFQRAMNWILRDHMPRSCRVYLDDIGVKGPKSDYDNKEALPRVRQYVLKHLITLDGILADLEQAEATILGEKLQFCMAVLKIVSYLYDRDS